MQSKSEINRDRGNYDAFKIFAKRRFIIQHVCSSNLKRILREQYLYTYFAYNCIESLKNSHELWHELRL